MYLPGYSPAFLWLWEIGNNLFSIKFSGAAKQINESTKPRTTGHFNSHHTLEIWSGSFGISRDWANSGSNFLGITELILDMDHYLPLLLFRPAHPTAGINPEYNQTCILTSMLQLCRTTRNDSQTTTPTTLYYWFKDKTSMSRLQPIFLPPSL